MRARKQKKDHLMFADIAKSRSKAGIWFQEAKSFRKHQRDAMRLVADQIDWVKLPNVIMAISQNPAGVVVIAPNPSLPGILVLADGTTTANTEKLQAKYTKIVAKCVEAVGVTPVKGERKK